MMNIEAFLHLVLTEIKGMYNADAGSVYYRENDTLRFVVVQTESLGVMLGGTTGNPITFSPVQLYKGDEKTPNYHNIASYVALTGETINIPNIYLTDQFDFSATKAFDANNNYQSISCLTVPLKGYRNDVIGVLQLLNACNDEGTIVPFDRAKQAITESLCVHVATILSNRLLIQQHTMMSKIENDLQIGRQIQSTFLPTKFPELPGWEIASYFHPAREVAGDFYDAFTMPGDRLGLVIADVCDKGVGAALFMSLMRSLIRAYAMQHYTIDWSKIMDTIAISARNVLAKKILPSAGSIALENAIKLTNQYVSSYHADLNMFATTFMGVLDPTKGSLLYINGGHCPPMHLDMEGNIKARLEATGPAVGMFQDAEFEISEVTLEPGDSLFMFTDGVTDVRNMEGRLFKEAGIMPLLQPPTSSIRELLNRVKDNIDNYMGDAVQFDDITMLGIRRDA
jgi:sigma-B regulation protein RsbU (phosphoserine phosphatase)